MWQLPSGSIRPGVTICATQSGLPRITPRMKKRCLVWRKVIPCSTMLSSLRSRVPRGKPNSIIVRRVSAVLAIRRNAQGALFIGLIQIPGWIDKLFMSAAVIADILRDSSAARCQDQLYCQTPDSLQHSAQKTRCKHQRRHCSLGDK